MESLNTKKLWCKFLPQVHFFLAAAPKFFSLSSAYFRRFGKIHNEPKPNTPTRILGRTEDLLRSLSTRHASKQILRYQRFLFKTE